jgi:hypothetical protein
MYLLLYLGIRLGRSLSKNCAANSHFTASLRNSPFEVLAHSHAQLQILGAQSKLLGHQIPLLSQCLKVLILGFRSGGLATSNGTNGHEPQEVEARQVLGNLTAERDGIRARGTAGLCLFARGVDLDVDVELWQIRVGSSRRVEQLGLFQGVDAGDAEEVRDLGEVLAVAGLEAADEVPVDGPGQQLCLLGQFLGVVFAKVGVRGGFIVEGEDVVCWL